MVRRVQAAKLAEPQLEARARRLEGAQLEAKARRLEGDILWKLEREVEGVDSYLRCLDVVMEAQDSQEDGR